MNLLLNTDCTATQITVLNGIFERIKPFYMGLKLSSMKCRQTQHFLQELKAGDFEKHWCAKHIVWG